MTRYLLEITRLEPWRELNEYEGTVEGVIDDRQVCCRVVLSGAAEWARLSVGDRVEADLYLDRHGAVTVVEPATPVGLRRIDGSLYEAVGVVLDLAEESVLLDCSTRLRLDLIPLAQAPISAIAVGDRLRVRGFLEADLDPEEDVL
jgi:hypothetical protein